MKHLRLTARFLAKESSCKYFSSSTESSFTFFDHALTWFYVFTFCGSLIIMLIVFLSFSNFFYLGTFVLI